MERRNHQETEVETEEWVLPGNDALCVRELSLPPELETPEEQRFKHELTCPRLRKSYRSYQEL